MKTFLAIATQGLDVLVIQILTLVVSSLNYIVGSFNRRRVKEIADVIDPSINQKLSANQAKTEKTAEQSEMKLK